MMELINWLEKIKYGGGMFAEWFGTTEIIEGDTITHLKGSVATLYIVFALLAAVIAYLIGSLNFGIVISKLKYKDDIRNHGSGNAGATNMLRTYGKSASALTLCLDILKALIITYGALIFGGERYGYIAGLACIIGHCFPVFFKFRGGKGVACTAAVILVLSPVAFVLCMLIFVVTVLFTKYVSLGSIFGACLVPVFINSTYPPELILPPEGAIASVLIAILVVYKHKDNIKRIMNKTESKISFGKKSENDE